ncbi:hypothetical protein C0991_012049 [Blastosporella zonata]|nr:hypothetical protein C0991_012049 [Blastosporella zonata]
MLANYRSEVVDDSEPEREELRQQEKGQQRRALVSDNCKRPPMQVVEITDDESTDGQGPVAIFPPNITAEYVNMDVRRPPDSAAHGALSDKTQSDDDGDDPKMSLARFAYPDATFVTRPALSRQASTTSSIAGGRKPPPSKKPTHKFAVYFSDSELGRVLKCVSCDIRWTSRKTAAQKMLHVQSCAKKKHLTDETVRILLRKEIDSHALDTSPDKGKGKAKATEFQTFLEEVVAEAAPRKKGRRLEVQETVKTVSQTRDLILNKARAVIGSTLTSGPASDKEPHLSTQAVGVRVTDTVPLLPTQSFGRSALAQAREMTSRLFDYDADQAFDNEDSGSEMPANTQTFAPSRLGAQLHHAAPSEQVSSVSSFTDFINAPGPADSRSINTLNSSKKDPLYRKTRTYSSPESSSASPPLKSSLLLPEGVGSPVTFYTKPKPVTNFERHDDDAFLHFDPEFENPLSKLPSTPPRAITKSTPIRTPRSKTHRSASPKTRTSATRRNRSPSKLVAKGKKMADEPIESLELRIRELIMDDTNLFLRVLRYEPIHFDVFLQLMFGGSPASKKQKAQLCSVLDKKVESTSNSKLRN